MLSCLLAAASTCRAAGDTAAAAPESSAVDVAHDVLSDSVNAAARWFDAFFDDPRVEQEAAYSRVKLSGGALLEAGERARFKGRVNARITLPRTRRRLKLIISRDDADRPLQEQDIRDTTFAASQEATAGLQYSVKATSGTDFSWRLGARLGGDRELFTGPRYRKTLEFDPWLARFTESLFWGTRRGWQSRTRVDFDRVFADPFFFRWTTEAGWREDQAGVRIDSDFQFSQRLDRKRALIYEATNRFVTSPRHRLEETGLRLRYRQQIWRRWLFFEAAPRLVFRNDDDFRPTPGLRLELQMIIGGPGHGLRRPEPQTQSRGWRKVS